VAGGERYRGSFRQRILAGTVAPREIKPYNVARTTLNLTISPLTISP
jgi:hypothetical protein